MVHNIMVQYVRYPVPTVPTYSYLLVRQSRNSNAALAGAQYGRYLRARTYMLQREYGTVCTYSTYLL